MSSKIESLTHSSIKKVPSYDPENFTFWSTLFQAHVGKEQWNLFEEDEPQIDDEFYQATLDDEGEETEESRAMEKQFRIKHKRWDRNQNKIHQYLVEACSNTKALRLLTIEFIKLPGIEFYRSLEKRYLDTSSSQLTFHVGILNRMACGPSETRNDFVERLSDQILNVLGAGGEVPETTRCERLLNGLKAHDKYASECRVLELLPQTWDSITAKLRRWDTDELNAKKDIANLAKVIICHTCGTKGHKSPECPNRIAGGKKQGGGVKRFHNKKKQHGRNFNGKPPYQGKNRNSQSNKRDTGGNQNCNICQEKGHLSFRCPYAEKFAKLLPKLKKQKEEHKNSARNYASDSDSSLMLSNMLHDAAYMNIHTAALDSGCSSHTLKESVVPSNVSIDSYEKSVIQTAHSGTTISALGRVDAGLCRKSLVVKDGDLVVSLISVSRLDRDGYYVIFGGNKAVVSKDGKVIITALLGPNGLYEFDVRLLTKCMLEAAMLGSTKPPEDLDLWHMRLGHRNIRNLKLAIRKNLLTGISFSVLKAKTKDTLCVNCVMSKSHKYPKRKRDYLYETDNAPRILPQEFPKVDVAISDSDSNESVHAMSNHKVNRQSKLRDLAAAKVVHAETPIIFTDLKGPIRTAGTRGEVFYQAYMASDTKFVICYCIQYKSNTVDTLRDLLEILLPAEGSRILAYCADGAPELISRDIVRLLAVHNCKMMYSPPYTPELNSVVERNHRTTFESGHAMLSASNLPVIFWCYAVKYAVLIYNHLPTNTAYGYMSPIQAKYNLVPDVSHFRKFGCKCYVHVPRETRDKGFVDKAEAAYFLGIDLATQSFIVWIISLNEEKISSNVLFDELAVISKQLSTNTLTIDPTTKNIKDFLYLVGMMYRDNENRLMYVTTRVVIQKGFIVTYRAAHMGNYIAKEEPTPIHVADVEHMLHQYLLDGKPMIVDKLNDGDPSPRTISLEPRVAASDVNHIIDFNDIQSSVKRSRGDRLKKETPINTTAIGDVQQTLGESSTGIATPAQQLSTISGQSSSSTGHRFPREAHSRPRIQLTLGQASKAAHSVLYSVEGEQFCLYMENFEKEAKEMSLLSYATDISASNTIDPTIAADLAEVRSIILEHNAWEVGMPPPDANLVTSKWVRLIKANGRHKSRICARGFNMIYGVDYMETFAPVAKIVTFRIVLTLIALLSLYTGKLDVKTAFLHAKLDETIWLEPPPNLLGLLEILCEDATLTADERRKIRKQLKYLSRGQKLRLLKALYGTKQASRQWYLDIDGFLQQEKFVPNKADNCFYTLNVDINNYVLLLLYVDDIIIAATTEELKLKYVKLLSTKYKISYTGILDEYLNIKIAHDRVLRTIHISQERYIEAMILQFSIPTDTSILIPMQENLKLLAVEEEELTDKQQHYVKNFPYRQLVGAILYLNICTRPAISYAISILAKFNCSPTFRSCKALLWLCKYLYNTKSDILILGGGAKRPYLVSFCDSDWGGCINTRYSRSGHINFLGNGPVCWYSKRQSNAAQSSAEAEYIAKAPCFQNSNFIRRIINCVNIPKLYFRHANGVWSDSQASIAISNHPVFHQRTKHIAIKYLYVIENVKYGLIVLGFIRSKQNCADLFTKPNGANIYEAHYPTIMGWTSIPRVPDIVKTTEEDKLPCPRCSLGVMHEDNQL